MLNVYTWFYAFPICFLQRIFESLCFFSNIYLNTFPWGCLNVWWICPRLALLMYAFKLPGRIAEGEQQADKGGWSAGAILSGSILAAYIEFFWPYPKLLSQVEPVAILLKRHPVFLQSCLKQWYLVSCKVKTRILATSWQQLTSLNLGQSWYIGFYGYICGTNQWYIWMAHSRCKWRRHFATLRRNMVWPSSRQISSEWRGGGIILYLMGISMYGITWYDCRSPNIVWLLLDEYNPYCLGHLLARHYLMVFFFCRVSLLILLSGLAISSLKVRSNVDSSFSAVWLCSVRFQKASFPEQLHCSPLFPSKAEVKESDKMNTELAAELEKVEAQAIQAWTQLSTMAGGGGWK